MRTEWMALSLAFVLLLALVSSLQVNPSGERPRATKKKSTTLSTSMMAIRSAQDAHACEAISRARCSRFGARSAYKDAFTSPPLSPRALHAVSSLRHLRIGAVGDSVTEQLYEAMQCYLGLATTTHDLTFTRFVDLHSVPLNSTELRRYLAGALSGVDVAVVSFGGWYDWEGDGQAGVDAVSVRADASEALIGACAFADDAVRQSFEGVLNGVVWDDASRLSRVRRLSIRRRNLCSGPLLGPTALASDMRRLVTVLEEAPLLFPVLVWKDSPPQHFKGRPSGRFESSALQRPSACGPVESAGQAYSRNSITDALVGNTTAFSGVARTWDHDLPLWQVHASDFAHRDSGGPGPVDCTHYCNPSAVTWNWVRAVLEAFVEALQRKKGGRHPSGVSLGRGK
jgi:hypothetical protein